MKTDAGATCRRVLVLAGGPSGEREVSLRSGAAVAGALRREGYEVREADPVADGAGAAVGSDVVFLALHGTYGEDGTVQRELERLGLPYTGCDAGPSAMAFDKAATVGQLRAAGVPVARSVVLDAGAREWPPGWEPPVVLKPVCAGSSLGLVFVETAGGLAAGMAVAGADGGRVLMEEKVSGRELTVGILEGCPLPAVEIRPRSGTYDYGSKYTPGATEYLCPAPLQEKEAGTAAGAAVAAYRAVGCRDYARVDLLMRADGSVVVLEVNTLPGMTATSLFPMAAARAGIGFDALCRRMVELAWSRRKEAGN